MEFAVEADLDSEDAPHTVLAPVEVHGIFSLKVSEEEVRDVAFVQVYEDVFTNPDRSSGRHPLVPGLRYVYLSDTFGVYEVGKLCQAALLVPNVTPRSGHQGDSRIIKSTTKTGSKERPCFYWVSELL